MYNAEQKTEFLNTIVNDNSYKAHARIFNSIEDIENRYGKDVCQMSLDEIITLVTLSTGGSKSTEQSISLLRGYVNWCIKNGKIVGENNFDKLTFREIDKRQTYKIDYVKSPDEFERMVALVFADYHGYNETIDSQKELAVRLCYMGMECEEIVRIKKDDVDYEHKKINSPIYPNIVYENVSDRILELCKYCSEQETATMNVYGGLTREEPLCDNDYVFRKRIGTLRGSEGVNDPMKKVVVIRRVKEFSDTYSDLSGTYKRITAEKLRLSYQYYKCHMMADKQDYREEFNRDERNRNDGISNQTLYNHWRKFITSQNSWENAFY